MRNSRFIPGLLPLFGLLAACNSSTKVTVQLTDAPPDTTQIAHVYVTLDHVEVHVAGSDDSSDESAKKDDSEASKTTDGTDAANEADASDDGAGWRTVKAHAGTFDLVALQNDVRATLGELDLPSGKITQIRLFIDPAGQNEVSLTSGQTCALDLTNVPPTGIKINHPFKALDVSKSSEVTLVVDFNLATSVDQTGACSFGLHPVIELKSVEQH